MTGTSGCLEAALILHLCELIARDATDDLQRLGLSPGAIASLDQLTVTDLVRIRDIQVVHTMIEFEPAQLLRSVHRQQGERQSRSTLLQLVRAGAPRRLVRELFGIDNDEFARLRRLLGCKGEGGHNGKPTCDEIATVRMALARVVTEEERCRRCALDPDEYLKIHEITGQPIWLVLKALERIAIENGRSTDSLAVRSCAGSWCLGKRQSIPARDNG